MTPKTRVLIIMLLSNLFFLGVLMGVIYFKQNLAAPFHFKTQIRLEYQDLSSVEKFKIFSLQIKQTFDMTGKTLHQRWSQLFATLKMKSLSGLLTLKSWLTNKMNAGTQGISGFKSRLINTGNQKNDISRLNRMASSGNQTTGNQIRAATTPMVTPPPTAAVETDPFLTLVAKLQSKATPIIEEKSNAVAKFPVAEKKVTPPLKIELAPQGETKPKIEEKSVFGKESEQSTAKNFSKYHLRGIVIGNSPTAYIEGPSGYQKLSVGDMIDTGQIIRITGDSVTVQIANEQVVLNVE